MKVPKGKTLYIGKKKLVAGDEIPATLEAKFSKALGGIKKPDDPPHKPPGDKEKINK